MKNLNIRKTFASLLVMTAIVSAPYVTFAKENTQKNNTDTDIKQYIDANLSLAHASPTTKKTTNNDSIWNRFMNAFSVDDADAATTTVDSDTPNISGITAPVMLTTGETGTWKVNASDPQNGSLTYAVNWGDAVVSPFAMMSPIFTQTSTFTHSYATAGTYTVTFTVSNALGLKTTSTVTVHVVGLLQTAPIVNDVTATASTTNPHQAIVTWTTDVNASSLVWYSKTSSVDTSGNAQVIRQNDTRSHRVTLTGLTPDTIYYIVVGSTNNAGTGMSKESSFKTIEVDTTTPVITSLSGNKTVAAGDTETVTINAEDPQNSPLTYQANWGDSTTMMTPMALTQPIFAQTATFNHIYANPGTYIATFTAKNSTGQEATSSMTIMVVPQTPPSGGGTTPPVIGGIQANASVTISWTTNEAATSKVFYSTTTPVDIKNSSTARAGDATLVTNHTVTISGLQANTLYHYIIESDDASGNAAVSNESTFTTNA